MKNLTIVMNYLDLLTLVMKNLVSIWCFIKFINDLCISKIGIVTLMKINLRGQKEKFFTHCNHLNNSH
jgi:hypothetical protein